jgi:hypothetical protein
VRYHIVILRPTDGTQFWRCFEDPARLLFLTLRERGHEVTTGNTPVRDALNILLGWNQMQEGAGRDGNEQGFRWIIWQLEQLHAWEQRFPYPPPWDMLELADAVWDYDKANIELLASRGIKAEHVPMGYHPELRSPFASSVKSVDALFFGTMSAYRREILNKLSALCNLHIIGHKARMYCAEMIPAVGAARLVLSLHQDRYAYLQEQVRITPLLCQGTCVVAEQSAENYYGTGIVEVSRRELISTVLDLLKDDGRIEAQSRSGLECIRRRPFDPPILPSAIISSSIAS